MIQGPCCIRDEAAQRLLQLGYDITCLTAQRKSELAALLTAHHEQGQGAQTLTQRSVH